jgi:O-antigen ligase
LLLLPASALFGAALLFVSLLQGCRGRRPPLEDPLNRLLLLVAGLMVLGCLLAYSGWLAWVGLGNWLPFFWGFWGFQSYLTTPAARRRAGLMLVAATVPVILTGLGQLWWGWHGPFQALGGLVTWHLHPGGNPEGRLAGLFDYANIAGSWLVLVWPLLLAALLQARQSQGQRLVVLVMAVALAAAVFLTDSRNAWAALVLALPLVCGPRSWRWLLPPLAILLLLVAAASVVGVPEALQEPARSLVPEAIWGRLSDLHHAAERPQAITRLAQWGTALELIGERPWLGWGAAAFSIIYPLRTGRWHGHPHNLPLDLALSHGLPVALLVVGFVVLLLLRGLGPALLRGRITDRAWWTAALVLAALHATDMPFYDSRINVAGWVLLAGVRGLSAGRSVPAD